MSKEDGILIEDILTSLVIDVLLETRKIIVGVTQSLLREKLLNLQRLKTLLARKLLQSILLVLH